MTYSWHIIVLSNIEFIMQPLLFTNEQYSALANLYYPQMDSTKIVQKMIALIPKKLIKKHNITQPAAQYFSIIDQKIVIKNLPECEYSFSLFFEKALIDANFHQLSPLVNYFKENHQIDFLEYLQNCRDNKKSIPIHLVHALVLYSKEKNIFCDGIVSTTIEEALNKDQFHLANPNLRLELIGYLNKQIRKIHNSHKDYIAHEDAKRLEKLNDFVILSFNKFFTSKFFTEDFTLSKAMYKLQNEMSELLPLLDYTRIEANLPIAKIINGNQAMNSVETQAFVWNIDMMKFHYEHHIENSAIRRNLDITHSYVENNLSHHKNIEHLANIA